MLVGRGSPASALSVSMTANRGGGENRKIGDGSDFCETYGEFGPVLFLPLLKSASVISPMRSPARTRPMTTLLEQAIDQLRKCSPAEQDTIAALILEELADETRWDEAFAASQPEIEQLAEKVRAKIRSGQTRDMRIEDL